MATVTITDAGGGAWNARIDGFTSQAQHRFLDANGNPTVDGWLDVPSQVQRFDRDIRVQWRDRNGSGIGKEFPVFKGANNGHHFTVDGPAVYDNVGIKFTNPITEIVAGESHVYEWINYVSGSQINSQAYWPSGQEQGSAFGRVTGADQNPFRPVYNAPAPEDLDRLDRRGGMRTWIVTSGGQANPEARNEFWIRYPRPGAYQNYVRLGARTSFLQNSGAWDLDPFILLRGMFGYYLDDDGNRVQVTEAYLKRVSLWNNGIRTEGRGRDTYTIPPDQAAVEVDLVHAPDASGRKVIPADRASLGWMIYDYNDFSTYVNWEAHDTTGDYWQDARDLALRLDTSPKPAQIHAITDRFFQHGGNVYNLAWNRAFAPAPPSSLRQGRVRIGVPGYTNPNEWGWTWTEDNKLNIGRAGPFGRFRTVRSIQLHADTDRENTGNNYRVQISGVPGFTAESDHRLEDESTFGFRITEVGNAARTVAWQVGGAPGDNTIYRKSSLTVEEWSAIRDFFQTANGSNPFILSWNKDGPAPLLSVGKRAWYSDKQIERAWLRGDRGEAKEARRIWAGDKLVYEKATVQT